MEDGEDYIEKLIQVIQSKPALYNKVMKEHSDRNKIKQLWNEVCEVMVEKWNELPSAEKTTKGNELQQRWRNLRTCFRRELNKQQKGKSGQASNKRRKYIFFDQLLFLLPTMEDRMTVSDVTLPLQEEGENESIVDSEEDVFIQSQRSSTKARNWKKKLTYEESLLAILKDKKTEEIDEDKTFLLSLVPSFKKFTDDQKIEAKMEFLKIIRRISQSNYIYKPTQSLSQSRAQETQSFTNNDNYFVAHSYPQHLQQPLSAICVPLGPSSASTSASTPEYRCSQSNPSSPLQLYDLP